jgi:hypothetical protein
LLLPSFGRTVQSSSSCGWPASISSRAKT